MKTAATLLGLAAIAVASQGSTAGAAATRSYFNPSVLGDRVAFCTEDTVVCGKPVADAWCRFNGYGSAMTYQRVAVEARRQLVRFADTGAVCSADNCLSFQQIKCIGES